MKDGQENIEPLEHTKLARTIKEEFIKSTPCFAQSDKSPFVPFFIPKSSSISLYMFLKDGGKGWFLLTEKHNPFA